MPGRYRRSIGRVGAFLIIAALIGTLVGVLSSPASAVMEGPCVATFNGIPFDDLDTPAKARERLVIQPGESVTAYGAAPDTDFIYIDVLFPPLAIPLISMESSEPGEQGSEISEVEVELPLGDFAKYGAGIFEFVARTDDCRGNAFFIIGGIAPWETAVGKTAVGVGVVGALIGLTSWIPAIVAGGGGIVRSVIAGGPVGVAIAVLVQQAGMIPLSGKSVGIAIVGSSIVAVVITKVLVGVHGAAAGASAGGGLPTPPPVSPPVATPPPQPPPPGGGAAGGAGGESTTVFNDPLLGGSEVPVPGAEVAPQPTEIPVPGAETAPRASTPGAGGSPPPPGGGVSTSPSSAGGSPPPPSAPGAGSAPPLSASAGGSPPPLPPPGTGTGSPPSLASGGATGMGSHPPSASGGSASPSSAPGVGSTSPPSSPPGAGASPSSAHAGGASPSSPAPAAGSPSTSPPSATGGASPAAGGPPISGLAAGAAAAVGATGVASRAAAARKRAAGGGQLVDPYWFHVTEATDVYGLDDYESILGQLVPGAWYLAKATYDEWVHVWDEESGLEGWAGKHAAMRQDG